MEEAKRSLGRSERETSSRLVDFFSFFFLFTFRIIYFQATTQILMFSKGDSDFEWTSISEPSRFIIEASSTDEKVTRGGIYYLANCRALSVKKKRKQKKASVDD